jgi:hypothetical protein
MLSNHSALKVLMLIAKMAAAGFLLGMLWGLVKGVSL